MKHIYTVLLIFISTCSLFSQTWFEANDTWVYRYFAPFATEGYGELNVSEEIIINGKESFLLTNKITAIDQSNGDSIIFENQIICYEEMDKVYRLNDNSMVFELLYDFSLNLGDSLTYFFNDQADSCKDSIVYYLDSLSTIEFNGEDLRIQYFSYYDVDWDYQGTKTIIERIGDLNSTFDTKRSHGCNTDQPGSLLCSFNNGQEDINLIDENCFDLPLSYFQLDFQNNKFYPNPTNSIIYIDNHETLKSFSIYNLTGTLIGSYLPNSSCDISDYSNGAYVLKFIHKNGIISTSLLLKQ